MSIKQQIKDRAIAFIKNNTRMDERFEVMQNEMNRRFDAVDKRFAISLWGDAYWYSGTNLWEPTVMASLRDLCKPGMTVFDVGGNMGGLTSATSRLVGPDGKVCTFEASPRIVGILQNNIVAQGHRNVTLYNRAVYSKSNESVLIYEGGHLNDSIYVENSPTKHGHSVKTLALDDFCSISGLFPELVKMDIEGAEFDALLGFVSFIEAHHPHLILEQQMSDSRCFEFLQQRGYFSIDLATYDLIKDLRSFVSGTPLRNLLFVHKSRIDELPFSVPVTTTLMNELDIVDFNKNHMNGLTSCEFDLGPGRYLLDVDFSAQGVNNNMMCGVRSNEGRDVLRYHGYSRLLSESYRQWVVDLTHSESLHVYFDFLDGTFDENFEFRSLKVRRIDDFVPSLWAELVMD